ncbi:hypothetical protein AcV5_010175 [Taiwanofungus camphoratus]|nr:hypothetical protein AcV5_010175 [Antrodia cinnamomea]KAI0946143.1 hypothetical protein AcV7_010192 [Antrodia cinnamomea]
MRAVCFTSIDGRNSRREASDRKALALFTCARKLIKRIAWDDCLLPPYPDLCESLDKFLCCDGAMFGGMTCTDMGCARMLWIKMREKHIVCSVDESTEKYGEEHAREWPRGHSSRFLALPGSGTT